MINNIYCLDRHPVSKEYQAIGDVLKTKDFINGSCVAVLESKLAEFVGAKCAIATSSGTAAEFLILKYLGIGRGDVVFVPDFTFMSTATAVKMAGATPIFVDINENFTMSPKSLVEMIRFQQKGIARAVIPVSLFGTMYSSEIDIIAKEYDLIVIEDGCHSLGSCDGIGHWSLGSSDFRLLLFILPSLWAVMEMVV